MAENASTDKKRRKKSKGGASRRSEKYPGLKPHLHPRTRWEYMDQDYFKDLSEEEKAFASKFNEEFYGASFKEEDNLHETDELKRECYRRNNYRNRDIYTIFRTRGYVESLHDKLDVIDKQNCPSTNTQEDTVIELLDMKQELEQAELSSPNKNSTKNSKNDT